MWLMFLFRGMPFIDLAHLRKQDVKRKTIIYCRHKTGKQLTVNIPKEALPLIREFMDTNPDSPCLFPILDSNLEDGNDFDASSYWWMAGFKINQALAK